LCKKAWIWQTTTDPAAHFLWHHSPSDARTALSLCKQAKLGWAKRAGKYTNHEWI